MEKLYFSGLNHEATIADLLSATEDEFSAILSKIKAEYKKLHGIKTMKRSVKPYKYVLQKMRKVYADRMNLGYSSQMDELLEFVCDLCKRELDEMGYTAVQFRLDFANEVAPIMASTIYQNAFFSSSVKGIIEKMVKEFKEKDPNQANWLEGFILTKENIASWAVFKGTVYTKSPFTGKKEGKCLSKACMTEGFERIITEEILKFETFCNMDKLIAKCAVVGHLFQQNALSKGKGVDTDALFKVPSTKSTSKKVENKAENEGVE